MPHDKTKSRAETLQLQNFIFDPHALVNRPNSSILLRGMVCHSPMWQDRSIQQETKHRGKRKDHNFFYSSKKICYLNNVNNFKITTDSEQERRKRRNRKLFIIHLLLLRHSTLIVIPSAKKRKNGKNFFLNLVHLLGLLFLFLPSQ